MGVDDELRAAGERARAATSRVAVPPTPMAGRGHRGRVVALVMAAVALVAGAVVLADQLGGGGVSRVGTVDGGPATTGLRADEVPGTTLPPDAHEGAEEDLPGGEPRPDGEVVTVATGVVLGSDRTWILKVFTSGGEPCFELGGAPTCGAPAASEAGAILGLQGSASISPSLTTACRTTLVDSSVTDVRYRLSDGSSETAPVIDATPYPARLAPLCWGDLREVVLVEALDADGSVLDSSDPLSVGSPLLEVARLLEWGEEDHQRAQAAVGECMASRGFDYEPLPYQRSWVLDPRWWFGPLDVERAAAEGYGPRPTQQQEPPAGLDPADEDAWWEALNGQEPVTVELSVGGFLHYFADGCASEGSKTVFPFWKDEFRLAAELTRVLKDVRAEALADDRVRPVAAEWRACMAEAGYEVRDPDDARDLAVEKGNAVAVADARCGRTVGLPGTWAAVAGDLLNRRARVLDLEVLRLAGELVERRSLVSVFGTIRQAGGPLGFESRPGFRPGALVVVADVTGAEVTAVWTDAAGRFALLLEPGTYELTVDGDDTCPPVTLTVTGDRDDAPAVVCHRR
jgi:hypothetical protein